MAEQQAPREQAPDPHAAAPAASSRRLMNATAVMASGTAISRVLGFVKATLLVIVLGATTPQVDAYNIATLVPNTLYMIFAGGALNTVLVPQIVRHAKSDADGGEAFINRIMTAFIAALLAVTALAAVFTPQVISLWTKPVWREDAMAGHWQQLVLLALLTMPQLFFYGVFFLIGQVLNARDKFGPMMWAPILNNVVAIGVLGLYLSVWGTNVDRNVPFSNEQVLLLGLGSTLGIVVQTLALIPSMRAIGFRYRPRWDLKGTGLGATFHLAKWMLGYVLLTSIVQAVVTNLASGATAVPATGVEPSAAPAGVAAYSTAYLVWILPHSLLTVSLATAMLPSASRLAAAHDMEGVAAETNRTMRLALTFLVPSAIGFLALGLPFARLAFGHGANTEGWPAIGWTLMAFAVGLIPYTIQYVYLRGFYALEDTRVPFFVQLAISVVNVGVALSLIALGDDPATVAPRLALAYSVAYAVGAWLTHVALKRKLPGLSGREVVRHTAQLLFAVAPGGIIAGLLAWWSLGQGFGTVLAAFLGAAALAAVTFFLIARRLGIRETTQLLAVVRRRGGAAASAPESPAAEPTEAAPLAGTEGALLEYPDPRAGDRTPALPVLETDAAPGAVLSGRYRLDQALNRRGSTVTWRGWDLKLSRPVLLHVLDSSEDRALEILDQARQAAPAVDTRFLRVWDAVLDEEGHGSYIVCEYAPGQSLELALRQGALSDIEAAWVVREVAAGLVGMHAQGLYHRQLNLDTVVITASGNVKIVGFLVEHALHPSATPEDPEQADVRGLGELLYASLTGRWPGPSRYGLPAAPTDAHGRPLLPRAVSKKISVELSDIVDRILSPTPRGRATRLVSAADIAAALSALLGGADASHLLDQRLRFPIEHVRITAPKPPRGAAPVASLTAAHGVESLSADLPAGSLSEEVPLDDTDADAEADTDPGSRPYVHDDGGDGGVGADTETTGPLQGRADARPAPPWGPEAEDATEAYWLDVEDDDVEDEPDAHHPYTPIPPPRSEVAVSQQAPSEDPPRRWQGLLLLLFALVLVASLIGVFVNQYNKSRALPAAPGTPYAVVAARDFDPSADGGDDAENPDLAPLAVDGDPATRWTTERYGRSPDFNGRKPGAGVLVDLGEPREVGWVLVNLGNGPTAGEIRVPVDDDATAPPMEYRDAWRRVAQFGPSTGEVRLQLELPATTRFVLVYLTDLPQEGPNHVGAIHEIVVTP